MLLASRSPDNFSFSLVLPARYVPLFLCACASVGLALLPALAVLGGVALFVVVRVRAVPGELVLGSSPDDSLTESQSDACEL